MSDGFNGKDYNDYFKKLEEQHLNNSQKDTKPQKREETEFYEQPAPSRRGGFRIRKSVMAVILALVLVITVCAAVSINKEEPEDDVSSAEPTDIIEKVPDKIAFKFDSSTPDLLAENDAQTGIVINLDTKKAVAARNPEQRVYPASTTKIMTLLVAVENITDFNDTFKMTYEITDPLYVQGASAAGFLSGEEITLTDMLYGSILPSGADASVGLAVKIAGSEAAFVDLMNEKVAELGLKNTHFANATGLHDTENYSTAYDMAVIITAAMQNEICREILSTYQHRTAVTPQHPEGILLTSTLFSHMHGTEPETATIIGGKTGFVSQSKYCIASFGKSNQSGTEYVVVTMGNSSLWPAIYGQIDLYKELAK